LTLSDAMALRAATPRGVMSTVPKTIGPKRAMALGAATPLGVMGLGPKNHWAQQRHVAWCCHPSRCDEPCPLADAQRRHPLRSDGRYVLELDAAPL
jgi:hypothetical protein